MKVLEVQPELTKLGATVEEATELSNAHDEVLLRLQVTFLKNSYHLCILKFIVNFIVSIYSLIIQN